jgi:uncharacterized protein (DUF2252 family)
VPRSSHGSWAPAQGRRDPIELLDAQNERRLPSLVPVRWGRMLESPFAFLRGSALLMARDLVGSPETGLRVQACGDAHVANYGVFASPERNLLFDLNDFDETFPGPWEWDLKRLATSAIVAARASELRDGEGSEAARAAVRMYRRKMAEYAQTDVLGVWYSQVDAGAAMSALGAKASGRKPVRSAIAQAEHHTSAAALPRLTALGDTGTRRIVDHPPLVTHDLTSEHAETLEAILKSYRASLSDDRRSLLGRFDVVDFALKVVGVGSVGTRCFIALLISELGDPLFLQVKEAERSVLDGCVAAPSDQARTVESAAAARAWPVDVPERALPQQVPARAEPEMAAPGSQGRRVVSGQRLVQAASDIFMGWASADGFDYYVRQLWDMKASVDLASMTSSAFTDYAELCGWTLARAHARSGHAAAIAGYAGSGQVLDQAIVSFARAYADQTERDHAALVAAVRQGRVVAETGV